MKHAAAIFISSLVFATASASGDQLRDAAAIPRAGDHQLRIVAPDLLEISITATRRGHVSRPSHADWIDDNSRLPTPEMPTAADLSVNGGAVAISSLGFKRNVLYAPLGGSEFTLANSLFVKLATPIATGATVTVTNPAADKWPADFVFAAPLAPNRLGPAVHANQVGYEIGSTKRAHIGYWLGDLGELDLTAGTAFEIITASDSAVVHSGTITHRPDSGYTYSPAPYQEVFQADFSSFDTPGEYRLRLTGLGASYPFEIGAGIDGTFARNDAAGFYHQRSGAAKTAPYTRHTDAAGHTAPAEIPSNTDRAAYEFLWDFIQSETGGAITGPADLRSPFAQTGSIDIAGGHHDAGDYSKYTINSAQAIHAITFAIDHFSGAATLDNLGLPESGDAVGDLLQLAKIEAEFLAKMQDSDGGFYLLVRPRDRSFETDVLPSAGDTQVVYPKNTAATAAGLAALAELGSSPAFAAAFPTEAATYLSAALDGWSFLQNAITAHGLAGSYQKITNSGDNWGHDDELAWAAAAMYAATGDPAYETSLKAWLPSAKLTQNPADLAFGDIRDFGFKRAVEGWGCALRAYSFGHRSSRVPLASYDASYLTDVDTELTAAADDVASWTANTAYGAALASTFKADGAAAYLFPVSEAFDALVGAELAPANTTTYLEAVRDNLNYVAGNNPNDMPFSTGIGWRRQREIVSQFAHNDGAVLPPVGLPLGAITTGPPYLSTYQTLGGENLLGQSLYPNVGIQVFPYYDRWTDSYSVDQEMTIPVLSRSVAVTSALFADSTLASQSWTSAAATITGVPAQVSVGQSYTATLSTPLAGGRTTWEATAVAPQHSDTFTFIPLRPGLNHLAADRLLPDGRRASARITYNATLAVPNPIETYCSAPADDFDVVAWYQLDGDFTDAKGHMPNATPSGNGETFDTTSFTWANRPAGQALRIDGAGDSASVTIPQFFVDPNRATAISVEAMVMFDAYPTSSAPLLQLFKPGSAAELIWGFDENLGAFVYTGTAPLLDDKDLAPLYAPNVWHHLKLETSTAPFAGYRVWIDGVLVGETISGEFSNWDLPLDAALTFGNFSGWIDEVIVRSVGTVGPPAITLLGDDTIRLRVGDSFSDPGAEAFDYLGNSLNVSQSGSVDPNTPGTYLITYSATDSDGYTSSATLTVIVAVPPQAGERIAIYQMEGHPCDGLSRQSPLTLAGTAAISEGTLHTGGSAGSATLSLPAGELIDAAASFGFAFEFELSVESFAPGDADLFTLSNGTDTIILSKLSADVGASLPGIATAATLAINEGSTRHLRVALTIDGYVVSIDGTTVATAAGGNLATWASAPVTLTLGGFTGAIDNLILTNIHPAVSGTTLLASPSRTFATLGDKQTFTIPGAEIYFAGVSSGIAIEGEIIVGALPGFGEDTARLLSLEQNYNTLFNFARDTWATKPGGYGAIGGTFGELAAPADVAPLIPFAQPVRVVVRLNTQGYQVWIGKRLVSEVDDTAALALWENNNDAVFEMGNLDGAILNPKVTRLEASPDTPFLSWAHQNIAATDDRGAQSDPDGDHSTNLEEYFFATDPSAASSSPDIRLVEVDGVAGIEFTASSVASCVTAYAIEASDDLENWQPIENPPIVISEGAGTRVLRAPLGSSIRTFYRVSLTLP